MIVVGHSQGDHFFVVWWGEMMISAAKVWMGGRMWRRRLI